MHKITNVSILTEEGILRDAVLLTRDGKIEYVGPDKQVAAEHVFDGQAALLVPGFIDLHIHGGAGCDFMDQSAEAVEQICRFHASHGTTGLLATTMTAPVEKTMEVVSFYGGLSTRGGASILGLHLEGPFINEKFKGAQNAAWIEKPTLENVKRVVESAPPGMVKMITLAPELVEDDEVFSYLKNLGIIISVGHSDLEYHGACRCMKKGVSHATHLGNAMRGLHHRNLGIVGWVMEQNDVTFDIIADGIHVAPELIRLLTRICSLDQINLITDAMRAAGLRDGQYELGGQEVTVKGMEARLSDGTLAGSVLTLDQALHNVIRFTGLPIEQVIRFITLNPAEKLGLAHKKGSIKAGKDADLVLLGDDCKVLATWVEGELVHRS
jgi:N-acetylglucosamine-6-phosphate deacetylase